MADGVNLPPAGTGDSSVKASTQKVTADSSDVQDVALATVTAGVRTRISPATEGSAGASATALGAVGDSAYASGSGSVVAILKGLFAKLPALVSGRVPVDGSGVTQPVSGSISVTGTMATSSATASQADGHSANIGLLADASSANTLTGLLKAIKAAITGTVAVSGTFWQATQPISGTVTTTPPANASTNLAQVAGATTATGSGTAAGALRVELPTNGTGVVGLATGSNTIGALTANQTVNNAQVAGTAVDVNSGNKSAGTQRVILATDQPQLTNPLKVDGSAVTQPVSSELATGLSTFSNTALSNTKTAVKASAGKVYGWMVHNPSAATAYIQVWNVAIGSITVGTTAPTWTIQLPAGASANVMSERGVTHSTEINVAATTTPTGSTAPATALVVSLFYI